VLLCSIVDSDSQAADLPAYVCHQWRSHTSGVRGVRTHCQENTYFWYVLTVYHCSFNHSGGMMTFFDCTADLVGQLNGIDRKN